MKAEEYRTRFRKALKGLSPQKQADLLEEIAAHLEEGQSDPRMGDSPGERAGRLERELGGPEELGRRLQEIHRHNRWVDYLLVVVPALLVTRLVDMALVWILNPPGIGAERLSDIALASALMFSSARVLFVINLTLIGIGILRWRRFGAPGLLIYWLLETWWSVAALFLREQRWDLSKYGNTPFETLFWLAIMLGLGFACVWILVHSRDPLMVVLALLPCILAAGNLITGQVMLAGGFSNGYSLPNWRLGYWGVSNLALLVWPILFFLFTQRWVRWLGLLVEAAPFALMNMVASANYPALALLWSTPVVLVVAGWAVDQLFIRTDRRTAAG